MPSQAFALRSLSDVSTLSATLPSADESARDAALARQNILTKPQGALGRLEDLAVFMAGWQGVDKPQLDSAQAIVFAGNHGVCVHGVSPFPPEVTVQMVANFDAGGAAINQLCKTAGADLSVVALDLDRPTADFTAGPAMSEAECLDAMNRGAAAVDPDAGVLLLGEMGIGNTTIASALCAALFGGEVKGWVGPGTGADAEGIARKIKVIEDGLARHADLTDDAMAVLAALGGREQAAICGAILAARSYRVPVLLDGFICTAAAATLFAADPKLLEHCLLSHASAEPGHAGLVAALGKSPLLDLGMRLGEGSGAAVALNILRAALACHNGMATFADAGVAEG